MAATLVPSSELVRWVAMVCRMPRPGCRFSIAGVRIRPPPPTMLSSRPAAKPASPVSSHSSQDMAGAPEG